MDIDVAVDTESPRVLVVVVGVNEEVVVAVIGLSFRPNPEVSSDTDIVPAREALRCLSQESEREISEKPAREGAFLEELIVPARARDP